ncbi:MAG: histidine kinase [Lewinellaceae bacterium]|nr:histidine kinase [Saprospiraceae bacterium]MCB9341870.1 histidine kinase [Lewinellaceae bacterium]
MPNWLYRRFLWNILHWQVLAYMGCNFLFGFIYWLAVYLNSSGQYNAWDQTLLSYGTKAIFSLPVYWVVFVKWGHWPLIRRLLLHLVLLPLFLVVWLLCYHRVCDFFGIEYLTAEGMVWDIYIPALLYLVQFGFIHFYEYVRKTQKQEQAAHELRQMALQGEMNALKAQLQPHFLFNTLNSISASVPPSMEHTRVLIARLADTFRFGLKASQAEWIPLSDEIHFLKTYLELEKQRFGDRLKVIFRVGEGLGHETVPPMLLQPLVENAVKHGVGNSLRPVTLAVEAERVGEWLRFEVSDTGCGYDGDLEGEAFLNNGIGLRNTRLRLEKQFGERLNVRRNEPSGLIFSFKIPFRP